MLFMIFNLIFTFIFNNVILVDCKGKTSADGSLNYAENQKVSILLTQGM
jgi:hypothetical protein